MYAQICSLESRFRWKHFRARTQTSSCQPLFWPELYIFFCIILWLCCWLSTWGIKLELKMWSIIGVFGLLKICSDAVGRGVPLGVGAHVAAYVLHHLPEVVDLAHVSPNFPDNVPDVPEEVPDLAKTLRDAVLQLLVPLRDAVLQLIPPLLDTVLHFPHPLLDTVLHFLHPLPDAPLPLPAELLPPLKYSWS